jgi:hypothetical protein
MTNAIDPIDEYVRALQTARADYLRAVGAAQTTDQVRTARIDYLRGVSAAQVAARPAFDALRASLTQGI